MAAARPQGRAVRDAEREPAAVARGIGTRRPWSRPIPARASAIGATRTTGRQPSRRWFGRGCRTALPLPVAFLLLEMIMPAPVPLSAAAAAAGTAAAALAGVWLARGSTAVPAGCWAAVAAMALAIEMACRAAGGLADPAASASARVVTLAVACCPTMALLGAKRPQHGVWQYIVVSLAVVLAMPAMTAALMRPGIPPDVHPLGRWFAVFLLAVGWMNFAGTRHGVAAALITVGQVILARPVLPFSTVAAGESLLLEAAACWLTALGACLAAAQSVWFPAISTAPSPAVARIEQPFLALRETLGAAWTLRIAERFNDLADARGWPCRLSFGGLEVGGDPLDDSWHRDAQRAFGALARRFATPAWLRRHGAREASPPPRTPRPAAA